MKKYSSPLTWNLVPIFGFLPLNYTICKSKKKCSFQSPEETRIRRRAGVSLSLSDTEAESEMKYHPTYLKFFDAD